LFEGKVDGMAEALQDARDGDAGLGEERVVIAGDEERDAQRSVLLCCKSNRDILPVK